MSQDIISQIINCLENKKIFFAPGTELSSLEVVLAAVAIEKAFNVKFDLDEITPENFASPESIKKLILRKTN